MNSQKKVLQTDSLKLFVTHSNSKTCKYFMQGLPVIFGMLLVFVGCGSIPSASDPPKYDVYQALSMKDRLASDENQQASGRNAT
jgi:hypothetical protein